MTSLTHNMLSTGVLLLAAITGCHNKGDTSGGETATPFATHFGDSVSTLSCGPPLASPSSSVGLAPGLPGENPAEFYVIQLPFGSIPEAPQLRSVRPDGGAGIHLRPASYHYISAIGPTNQSGTMRYCLRF